MNSVSIFESFEEGGTPNRILQDIAADEDFDEGDSFIAYFLFFFVLGLGLGLGQIYRKCTRGSEDDGQVETTAVDIEIPNRIGIIAVSNGQRETTKQTTNTVNTVTATPITVRNPTTPNTVTATPITVSNPSNFPNDGAKKTSRWFSPVN